MGDNFLEGQAKNTKKRRTKATSKMLMPKLISRPDEIVDEFTLDCLDGLTLAPGDVLRCFPGMNGAPVDVVREHRNIGSVNENGGGGALRRQIEQQGVGRLHVRSFNEFT